MKIIEIPEFKDKKKLLVLESKTSVEDAAKQMKALGYGSTVIVDDNKLKGIFTERDILFKIVAGGLDYKKLSVSDVMTKNVETAKEDDEVYDAMRRMTKGKFRHLPIVNEKGEVTGMVSQGDFVAINWSQLFHHLKSQTKISISSNAQIWLLVTSSIAYIILIYYLITNH